ncbi:MAG TPA: 3-deoxy-7-phosphoheptulonate synthase [Acidobacteriota bacterium]|jgi:3-deoxy-7-phosphoheptulonate synthase|nr:3-deoxy-7-phosphoheptulonate synthase [Acidobacteriota bacterium]
MIVVMKPGASREQIEFICKQIEGMGFVSHPIHGVERTVIGAVGDERGREQLLGLALVEGVEAVIPIMKPYKLASRELKKQPTVVKVGNLEIGPSHFVVMAGPCSVESEQQIVEAAEAIKAAGANILRGGAFKPRTSPYSFQGLEKKGLELLAKARQKTGLPVVTEVLGAEDMTLVSEYTDILQIGARNMQNFPLLKSAGKAKKPVLLKRGMMCTVKELLMSAEYILSHGNSQVILCERGIRTFEDQTRNTLDLSAVPLLKELTHLPIIVDPTHGTGVRSLISPMARAAVAAGCDGLMVEVHPHPELALSDGAQSLNPSEFSLLMQSLRPYLGVEKRALRPAELMGKM